MMLKRFKNHIEGPTQFAKIIEQASSKKRDQFITLAKNEDPAFLETAMRKVVFFDELVYLEKEILVELLNNVSAKVLAYALQNQPTELRDTLFKEIDHQTQSQIRDEQAHIPPALSEGEIQGAQHIILKTARKLEDEGKFTFELNDCPRFHHKKKKK